MTRLAMYLKPYLTFLGISIALLFIQANCDLALPDYMSKIVDIGIQQGGVQSAAPDAIRKATLDRLVASMSPADARRVLEDYALAESTPAAVARYVSKYPVIASEPIYLRKELKKEELDAISPLMARAWLAGGARLQQPEASIREARGIVAQHGSAIFNRLREGGVCRPRS